MPLRFKRDYHTKRANITPWDMKKQFFHRKTCANCIYARTENNQQPWTHNCKNVALHCERSVLTGETCLSVKPDGSVFDRRGDDPDNCNLKKRRYTRRKKKC